MKALHTLLADIPTGEVPDPHGLDLFLADHWDQFEGSGDGGMEAYKLRGRMEQVRWEPPILRFVIERHGGTVCGSTRADLQHWAVDIDAGTAEITKTGHRQLYSMAPRLSIKGMAGEIAQAILNGTDENRIAKSPNGTVTIRTSAIFPADSGYKRTIQSRRKRLCEHVAVLLEPHGWKQVGSATFEEMGKKDD